MMWQWLHFMRLESHSQWYFFVLLLLACKTQLEVSTRDVRESSFLHWSATEYAKKFAQHWKLSCLFTSAVDLKIGWLLYGSSYFSWCSAHDAIKSRSFLEMGGRMRATREHSCIYRPMESQIDRLTLSFCVLSTNKYASYGTDKRLCMCLTFSIFVCNWSVFWKHFQTWCVSVD